MAPKHSLGGEECLPAAALAVRGLHCRANSAAKFKIGLLANEHFVSNLSELRVQQAAVDLPFVSVIPASPEVA